MIKRPIYTIKQGETLQSVMAVFNDDDTPVDLTPYTVRMQIRLAPEAPLLATPDVTKENVNHIRFKVPATETTNWPAGDVFFDVDLLKDEDVYSLVRSGVIRVIKPIAK